MCDDGEPFPCHGQSPAATLTARGTHRVPQPRRLYQEPSGREPLEPHTDRTRRTGRDRWVKTCPRGWRSDGAESIELAREAVNTCYWPLFEVEDGEYRLTYRPKVKLPLAPWLKRQGRFAHLFRPGNEQVLENLQAWVDEEWEKLLRKCGEPPQTAWEERLAVHGCMYVPEGAR